MLQIRVTRIDEPALCQFRRHHRVKPIARLCGIQKITCSQNDGPYARSPVGVLHRDADAAQGIFGSMGRAFGPGRRCAGTKDIDIARHNHRGAAGLGRRDDLCVQIRHLRRPVGIGRVPGRNDHILALRRLHQIVPFAIKAGDLGPRLFKGMGASTAEPSRGAENENLPCHDLFLPSWTGSMYPFTKIYQLHKVSDLPFNIEWTKRHSATGP